MVVTPLFKLVGIIAFVIADLILQISSGSFRSNGDTLGNLGTDTGSHPDPTAGRRGGISRHPYRLGQGFGNGFREGR